MKKKGFLILILFLGIILIGSGCTKKSTDKVVINKYQQGQDTLIKTVTIDSEKDIQELSKYVDEIKSLEGNEIVSLALAKEIEVLYNDSITIHIQTGQENYCLYINKDEDIASLAHMPDGLYEWVQDKLK